jgi:hypothetical protein
VYSKRVFHRLDRAPDAGAKAARRRKDHLERGKRLRSRLSL